MEVFVFIVIFAWIINMCWLPIYFSEKHKDMNWLQNTIVMLVCCLPLINTTYVLLIFIAFLYRNKSGCLSFKGRLKDENGNWLFANDCEIACQFNKSNCDDFIRCVLSTYFKINCKV